MNSKLNKKMIKSITDERDKKDLHGISLLSEMKVRCQCTKRN